MMYLQSRTFAFRFLFFILLFSYTSVSAAEFGKVITQKVAENVYLFRTTPYGDVGMSGNSVAVLTDSGVLIFDSTAIPQTAQTILNELKKITDEPVQYLINSHWHWDHWGGNEVYLAAYPEIQIISHQKTREQLQTVEPRWNDEGLKVGLPAYLADFEKKIEEARASANDHQKLKELDARLSAGKNFLQQKTFLKKTLPNLVFTGSLTLWPEGPAIQVHHAAAITVGDSFVFLPKEKILITGDIMLAPFPYAIGGTYPAGWLKTLQKFEELKPVTVIPGHGDPQNAEMIQKYIAMFERGLALVKEAKQKGQTAEQAKKAIGEKAPELASLLGISDTGIIDEFKAYFLNVFVARALRELDGPLGELPDGLK